ncbi:MAG: hypothetical protein R3D63_16950 [Paracoccaceae bacterium]
MAHDSLVVQDRRFTLEILTADTAAQDRLDAGAAELFGLFLSREAEFGFNPDVVVDYPDIAAGGAFLADPAGYVAARRDAAGAPVDRVVVLTTLAPRVGAALEALGFLARPIDMPAGPDGTAAFLWPPVEEAAAGRVLYVEAVDEADPKIRPNFVLRLLDETGALQGGACGSIHARDGRPYAYLATMTLAGGLPPGTGTRLAAALVAVLRRAGVAKVHLGTQTAGPFYEKLGFRTVLRLIPALRHRQTPEGRQVPHDLVMMELDLTPG